MPGDGVMSYDPPDDGWHEVPEDEYRRGTFTPAEPGLYGVTIDGVRRPLLRVRDVLEALTPESVTDRRELPKDEPIGHPEKWKAMNRAERRAAKRGRRN